MIELDKIGHPPTVTVEDIRPLSRLAADANVSFQNLLLKLGLTPDLLNGPKQTAVTLADYFRILDQLSVAAYDETCHLSTRPLMPGTTRFVLSNLSECANLYEAMKLMAKSYNMLHGGRYNRVEKRGDFLVYIIDDSEFPYAFDYDHSYIYFTMDCVVILLHAMLSFITSNLHSLQPKKIYSKRPRRDGGSGHLSFWSVPVRCNAGNYALFYDISAASMPVTFTVNDLPSSKTIYNQVIAMIDETYQTEYQHRDLISRVSEALEQGVYDQPSIAKRLGVSVATLRRRLKQENVNFRLIRYRVLNESAKLLLSQHCHVSDVAEQLGFSDFRSFIRAFKHWNGMTPKTYVDTQMRNKVP